MVVEELDVAMRNAKTEETGGDKKIVKIIRKLTFGRRIVLKLPYQTRNIVSVKKQQVVSSR